MKAFRTSVALAVVLACCGAGAAQECPPGGEEPTTEIVSNGQTLQLSATGIDVTIELYEISATRIAGVAVRVSGGTTEGCVTIRWVNQGVTRVLRLSPLQREAPFAMVPTPITRTTWSRFKSIYH